MNRADSVPLDRGDDVTLTSLLRILWQRRLVLIACMSVGATAAAVVALTSPSQYTAQAVVTEVAEDPLGASASVIGQLGGLASLAGVNLTGVQAGQESKALLKSNRLVDEFIRRKQLLPQLFPGKGPKSAAETQWFGVRRFRARVLSVKEDSRTGLITVSIKWTDPKLAAIWANDFVALANELLRVRSIEDVTRNIAYLEKQIALTDVVEIRNVIYRLIESETKKLMLANARSEYAFAIVDPAVPPEMRTSPRRAIMILFGMLAGLAVGAIYAFSLNAISKRNAISVGPS